MVRLKDIAKMAGVSVMTVSKALRDKPDIALTTRERIQRMAAELHYVAHPAASGLRTRTTRLLGLVIPAITDPVFARLASAVEQNAHERGYELVLLQSMGSPEREDQCLRRVLSRRVDGLLVAPVPRLTPRVAIYDELRECRLPTVILGQRAQFCAGFSGVESDDLGAATEVTRHLLSQGHRRIVFFAGPQASPWAAERLEGYRRAFREAGLPLDDQLVFNAGATVEEGAGAALKLIQEGIGATALQAVNDLVAIGAANTLLNQGVRIPQDLAVAGFGNVLVGEYFRVPLTTVRQPKYRLGALGLEQLLRLLRGEPVEPVRLAAELVVRESTRWPRPA